MPAAIMYVVAERTRKALEDASKLSSTSHVAEYALDTLKTIENFGITNEEIILLANRAFGVVIDVYDLCKDRSTINASVGDGLSRSIRGITRELEILLGTIGKKCEKIPKRKWLKNLKLDKFIAKMNKKLDDVIMELQRNTASATALSRQIPRTSATSTESCSSDEDTSDESASSDSDSSSSDSDADTYTRTKRSKSSSKSKTASSYPNTPAGNPRIAAQARLYSRVHNSGCDTKTTTVFGASGVKTTKNTDKSSRNRDTSNGPRIVATGDRVRVTGCGNDSEQTFYFPYEGILGQQQQEGNQNFNNNSNNNSQTPRGINGIDVQCYAENILAQAFGGQQFKLTSMPMGTSKSGTSKPLVLNK